jgi:hypothetical protein
LKKIYILIVSVILISGIILINISDKFPNEIKENENYDLFENLDSKTKTWALFGSGLPFEFTEDELSQMKNIEDIIVIDPIFTQIAYREGGFYDYFRGECDEKCLTLDIGKQWNNPTFTSSAMALRIFNELGWDVVNDLEVHKNPNILLNYKKIILLHNEYVTREIFDAVISHPNVIYLYPNSLYAQIEFNENTNSITLIRGHNYPENNILNGFNWEDDNTHPYEFDKQCNSWKFYENNNGFMLNCYPEKLIITEIELLEKILDL